MLRHYHDRAWSPLTAPLVEALCDRQRDRATALIERAYTSVTVAAAAAALGLAEGEAVERCTKQGWESDPAAGLLRPKGAKDGAAGDGGGLPLDGGLRQLEQLTSYIVHLETTGQGPADA